MYIMMSKTMTHQLQFHVGTQKKTPGFTEIPQLNPTVGWIPQVHWVIQLVKSMRLLTTIYIG